MWDKLGTLERGGGPSVITKAEAEAWQRPSFDRSTMFILHAVISGMYRSEQRNDNKMPALLQAPLSSVIWLCLRDGGGFSGLHAAEGKKR